MIFPEDLRYHEKHMWVREDGTVGLSDFAQSWLGELERIEVSGPGTTVAQGEVLGQTESFKFVRDLYSPVSGKIRRVNTEALDKPGIINEDPYGSGWIAVIEMSDPGELDGLLRADVYEKSIESRLFL